ncbi:MAG: sensor histidine kinase [Ideonella sp.]|jgi:two-component system, NarL family, sensor histidine kinase UhpB|nr:sensor histidine kinase [Ideonella sp.]
MPHPFILDLPRAVAACLLRGAVRLTGWLALLVLGLAEAATPLPWLLDHAQVVALQPGTAPDWTQSRPVNLPQDWNEQWPGPSGLAVYRFRVDRPAGVGDDLLALSIERACNTLWVSLNGVQLHQGGQIEEPVTRQCQRRHLVVLPAALLRSGTNLLDITVRGFAPGEVGSSVRAGGLSSVVLGPHALLAPAHDRRLALSQRLPEVLSGTLVLLGGFMFVLGWFHRKQSYLAYFGVLMIGWALLLSQLWVTDWPWSNRRTEVLLVTVVGVVTMAGVQFLMRYAGRRLQWLDLGLPLQCGVILLSLLAVGPQRLQAMASVWYAALTLEFVVAATFYLRQVRPRQRAQLWLMAPLLVLLGLGLLTESLAHHLGLDERVGLLAQVVPALVLVVLGMRLVQQYGRALQSAEQGRAELEVRIREATAQIERNFAQLADLKVEQVTERERKRIAADLHDDLGAKLLTIVHTSDNERISTLAREALEEMRLSVRGLTGKPMRLADALGDWRAEVVSRLTQSGVETEWQAPSEEDVPQTLSARAFVQTTRIMREAVSNVIKHSGATRCSIRCILAEGDFQLVIQDNGNGIPAALDGRLDKGHGMASMKGRAKQLQGQCLVESGPGYGTVIRLTLPLDRHVTAR